MKFEFQHVIDLNLYCAHHNSQPLIRVQKPFEHRKLPYRSKQYRCNICDEFETINEFTDVYLCPLCRDDNETVRNDRKLYHHGYDICHKCYAAAK
jgi:Zn finger protein HypA/HybF involved in hydrogenase expression